MRTLLSDQMSGKGATSPTIIQSTEDDEKLACVPSVISHRVRCVSIRSLSISVLIGADLAFFFDVFGFTFIPCCMLHGLIHACTYV